jgi:hypothetical protein
MLKNKILLLFTNHRVAEKLWPVIPELSKTFTLDLFLVGLFSSKTPWVGDIDERKEFITSYSKYLNKVIEGPGIKFHGDRIYEDLSSYIDIESYSLVLFDDNREMSEFNIPNLYEKFRSNRIVVIGNSHGNEDFNSSRLGIGKSFDKLFTFGPKEKYTLHKKFNVHEDLLLEGGIPQNDLLARYVRRSKYILVITNFLGNRSSIFPINFDHNFIRESGLQELSDQFNLPIVVKQKTRLDDPHYKENINYIKSIIDCEVVTNSIDISKVIADSFCVISTPSTLAFKPIQLGIPTVLVKGSGQVGNFYDYEGLVDLNKQKIEESIYRQIDFGKQENFIKLTIKGGETFTSTLEYVNTILNFYENSL